MSGTRSVALPPGPLSPELLDAAVEMMGRCGRGGTVRVTGRSMEPTLLEGQTVVVEFAAPRLRTGDLLVFRQLDYLVVHRLLGQVRRGGRVVRLRTRGDGVAGLDPPVPPERVVGRVVAVRRPDGGGWISVRNGAARAYGRALAWHDRLWALATHLARRGDGLLHRAGLAPRFAGWTWALDRLLMRAAHQMLHRRVHRPAPTPPEAGGGDPASAGGLL